MHVSKDFKKIRRDNIMYSETTEMQLLLRMGLILLLGFLVGVEREWSFQKKRENKPQGSEHLPLSFDRWLVGNFV